MAYGLTEESNYQNIANAIRAMSAGDASGDTYLPSEMAPAIRGLKSYWGNIEGTLSDQTDLQNALNDKSDTSHTHDDRYYTETETDALLSGKAAAAHTHDDRYYTETEVDSLFDALGDLAAKDKVDWDTDIDDIPSAFPPSAHNHDDRYYTESEMDTALAGKAAASHTHDDRYYTESETDTLLAGKAAAVHDHDDRYYTETETNNKLYEKLDAELRTLSGDIVSWNSENTYPLKGLSVSIDPVQDLHGYDNPWPAGGGKNLLDTSWVSDQTKNDVVIKKNSDGSISMKGTASDTFQLYDQQNSSFSLPAGTYTISGSIANNQIYLYEGNTKILESVGGNYNTFTTTETKTVYLRIRVGSGAVVNGTIKPQLESGSSATSFAPYSNVCPITGHASANVWDTGKNMLPLSQFATKTDHGITCTPNSDGTISLSGTSDTIGTVNCWLLGGWDKPDSQALFMLQPGTYTIHGLCLYRGSNGFIQSSWNSSTTKTITEPMPVTGIRIGGGFVSGTNYDGETVYPQLEIGSSYTGFEDSNIQSLTISLGSTVYGAQLNVLTGELTVDRAMVALDNRGTWTKSSSYPGGFYMNIDVSVYSLYNVHFKRQMPFICSHAKTATTLEEYLPGTCYCDNSINIRIMEADTTVEQWQQYLQDQSDAGTPVEICAYLATPVTYTLTPETLSSLLGSNNLWCDTGASSVTLRLATGDLAYKDKADYETDVINKPYLAYASMLSGTETSMKATKNYTAGALIAVGDKLLKASSPIASGTTLTVGSNVTATTIEAELALKAASSSLGTMATKNDASSDDKAYGRKDGSWYDLDGRYYTESETDTKLSAKANSADVYTKTAADELLDEKLNTDADTTLTDDILSFDAAVTDAIRGLTIDIDPVQDLHGYANPWPGGAVANLVEDMITGNIESNGTVSTTDFKLAVAKVTQGETYVISRNGQNDITSGTVVCGYFTSLPTVGSTTYNNSRETAGPNPFVAPITGYVAVRFNSNAAEKIQIEKGSTITSYVPYSNLCPITGWSNAVVNRTGKNLAISALVSTLGLSDGKVSYNASGTGVILTSYLKKGITYKISGVSINRYVIGYFDSMPSNGDYTTKYQQFSGDSFTANYDGFALVYIYNGTTSTATAQIEVGTVATVYETPQPVQTLTISLGSTVYGATLDVLAGTLTVTKEFFSRPLSDFTTSTMYATVQRFYRGSAFTNTIQGHNGLCNIAPYAYNTSDNVHFYIDNNQVNVFIPPDTDTSTVVQVCATLATPLTVQLTPAQLSSLIGSNTLWADTGASTLTLRTGAGHLAYQDVIDYNGDYLINKPSLDSKADIIQCSASGPLVHLTDAASYPLDALSVGIEPVQDLHGYDNPWPAGGGKNLLPITIAEIKVANTSGTWNGDEYTRNGVTFKFETRDGYVTKIIANGTASTATYVVFTLTTTHDEYVGKILNGCPSGGSGTTYLLTGWNETDSTNFTVYDLGSGLTIPDVTGKRFRLYAIVQSGYTANNLTFQPMIRSSSVTDATFAPYSNICPITGHSSAAITRTGKNLCSPFTADDFGATISDNGLTVTTQVKTTTYANFARLHINPIKVIEGSKYYISFDVKLLSGSTKVGVVRLLKDDNTTMLTDDGTNLTSRDISSDFTRYSVEVTCVKDGIAPKLYIQGWSNNNGQIQIKNLCITIDGSTEYKPYTGTFVTIDLDGTRYGGILDVLTGQLRVTHKSVDMGTLTWVSNGTITGGVQYGTYNLTDKKYGETNFICSVYKTHTPTQELGQICGRAASSFVACNSTIQTAQEFTASVNGQTIVYELATPLTFQLTPAQLTTLLGENNIWCDTGDTELTYRADTKLYIDQQIASRDLAIKSIMTAVEPSMTLTANRTSGQVIIVGDSFYKLTGNVNSGAALVPGTNCTKVTMAEWILSIV